MGRQHPGAQKGVELLGRRDRLDSGEVARDRLDALGIARLVVDPLSEELDRFPLVGSLGRVSDAERRLSKPRSWSMVRSLSSLLML